MADVSAPCQCRSHCHQQCANLCMMGYKGGDPQRCCSNRWYKVVRTVVMRQRCTRQALRDAPVQPARIHTNTVPFSSFFGSRVSGPQLSLVFIMQAPTKYPGHPDFKAPPPAELDVEVRPTSLTAPAVAVLLAHLHRVPGSSCCSWPAP